MLNVYAADAAARAAGLWYAASNGPRKRHWFISRGEGTAYLSRSGSIIWFASFEAAASRAGKLNAALRRQADIPRSAATDAGNRSMHASGRSAWSIDDYNAACAEFNRLNPAAA